MAERVLVTGGAGFIGSHVCNSLLRKGYQVRVLDSLIEQVHGSDATSNLPRDIEFLRGDIRDCSHVNRAVAGADHVIHLAAEVGVGQSMYAIDRYVSVNELGTAVLFQALLEHPVQRVVVASSMSIYGEGLYRTADGQPVENAIRAPRRRRGEDWNPRGNSGEQLIPVPTPEWKRPALASVYALGKFAQETMTMTVAPAFGMTGVALRLFNVYGPGQALSNPYTGALAIFASRLLNGQRPLVFEDGEQRRDFVHVDDVARAFVLALETPAAAGQVFNIASGQDVSIGGVASALAAAMGRSDLQPELTGKMRTGDIRHCIADISLAERELGFRPLRNLQESLGSLVGWVQSQQAVDRVGEASLELEVRGLVA